MMEGWPMRNFTLQWNSRTSPDLKVLLVNTKAPTACGRPTESMLCTSQGREGGSWLWCHSSLHIMHSFMLFLHRITFLCHFSINLWGHNTMLWCHNTMLWCHIALYFMASWLPFFHCAILRWLVPYFCSSSCSSFHSHVVSWWRNKS